MLSLRSLQEFALDVLEAILPTDGHDDLMAIADAVGVTAPAYDVDEPVPYTVTDRIPFQQSPGDIDERDDLAAVLRGHTSDDFAQWEAQVWS